MNADDERLAKASRMLRHRQGLKQLDLVGGGRSYRFVHRLENDGAGNLRLNDVRDHFSALGAHVRITSWWNGAALDRLLDARHAALVERAVGVLRPPAWRSETEVTFSEYGERGSIDILAAHEEARAVLVSEVKSEWGSIEETNRRLDVKVRLAPKVAKGRFGWWPQVVGCVLILPNDSTQRRIAERHRLTLASAYPARSREVRTWLRQPNGPLRGLWFLSELPRPADDYAP